jgi:chemosensory pili system protein ChpA (sensor histidine kinase/response regulator)
MPRLRRRLISPCRTRPPTSTWLPTVHLPARLPSPRPPIRLPRPQRCRHCRHWRLPLTTPPERSRTQADAASAAPAPDAPPLPAQALALAAALRRGDFGDAEALARLDALSHQAAAADEADLARKLGAARRGLAAAPDAAVRDATLQALTAALDALLPPAAEPLPPPLPVPPVRATPADGTGLEDDAEMRDIFLDEAREVVAEAGEALQRLAEAPESVSDMTVLRRAFHTLKGSSRMVGLRDFGEAAWACEQLFNARLAQHPRMDAPLRQLTGEALAYLGDWTEAIAAGQHLGHASDDVARAADALRLHGQRLPVDRPTSPVEPAPAVERTAPAVPMEAIEPAIAQRLDEPDAADLQPEPALAFPDLVEPALPDDVPTPVVEAPTPVTSADTLPEPAFEPAPEPEPEPEPLSEHPPQPEQPVAVPVLDFSLDLDLESAPTTAAAGAPLSPLPEDVDPGEALRSWLEDLPPASDAALNTGQPTAEPWVNELEAAVPVVDEPLRDLFVEAAAEPGAGPGPVADTGDTADTADTADTTPFGNLSAPALDDPASPQEPAEPTAWTVTEPVTAGSTSLAERVPGLPSATDLDLGLPDLVPPDAAAPVVDGGPLPEPEPDFELDLGTLDGPYDTAALPPRAEEPTALTEQASEPADPPLPPVTVAADAMPAPEMMQPEEPHLLPEVVEVVGAVAVSETAAPPDVPEAPEVVEAYAVGDDAPPSALHPEVPEVPADALSSEQAEPTEPAESAEESFGSELGDDGIKQIGPLRIPIPLFNIYLNEADEQSRRLCTTLAEWALEHDRQAVPDEAVALAHSLAGNSATVGYADLSALARALEHALMRAQAAATPRPDEPALFCEVADEIRRLLHQFAAGFLRPVPPALLERLAEHERWPVEPLAGWGADPAEAVDTIDVSEVVESLPALEALAPPEAVEPDPPAPPPPVPVGATLPGVFASDLLPLAAMPAMPAEPGPQARADAFDDDEDIDAVDALDAELFPIFAEEAEELLPQLQSRLRDWLHAPGDSGAASACMRTLHTLKGGARLAGAMRLGEMAHRLETAIEHLVARDDVAPQEIEALLARGDAMATRFEALSGAGPEPAHEIETEALPVEEPADMPAPQAVEVPFEPTVEAPAVAVEGPPEAGWTEAPAQPGSAEPTEPTPSLEVETEPAPAPGSDASSAPAPQALPVTAIDWSRFTPGGGTAAPPQPAQRPGAAAGAVRVRAALLDRLVNNAGEVSITRARIDAEMRALQGSLGELTDSLERLRRQLRDIELQAETQMSSRLEAAKAASVAFDPLEMDRFTRFQELTRFMAESVNDVATLQRSLQRTLQSTEDELAAQARLTRELQDDLLRTRMVEFESLADRLYRTVRQASKDAAKPVRLDLVGGAIEVDRGVLERMVGPFEHLLRNAVAHGIEPTEQRLAAGKPAEGRIEVHIAQTGNEVAVEFADDGGGLDLARIRERAVARGLLAADAPASDVELAQIIFAPGFSTAEQVTELAGRGVGMDVVRAEVTALGGRIETASTPGQGTRFRLLLPLTTAVTQVVMLRCGDTHVAVPSTLVEIVRRVPAAEVEQAYAEGRLAYGGEAVPFFRLSGLLRGAVRAAATARTEAVVVVRSAAQRVALHVDEVTGNQEVVVKNVGPQLARVPGLVGVTLLASGAAALIYNPVALAALHGPAVRTRLQAAQESTQAPDAGAPSAQAQPALAPLVLVVDDSLTVRRVTQRLLLREGYRVATAKDGLDALEKLTQERPAVLLSDIEMPRMDGFDLLRNVRADTALAGLPVIMITSRTAQKHRDLAAELGADHYLGKPYGEEELLTLVAGHAAAQRPDLALG